MALKVVVADDDEEGLVTLSFGSPPLEMFKTLLVFIMLLQEIEAVSLMLLFLLLMILV